MNPNVNLRVESPNEDNNSLLPVTGKLRYVTDRTRPDLLVSIGEISSGGATDPSDAHIKVSKQIVNYLKSTAADSLRLGGKGSIKQFAFCDASYVTTGKCLSRIGGCIFSGMYTGAFYSFSKNDTTVSHSSTEAEIKALDETIRAVIHTRNIFEFLGFADAESTVIYMDNCSAIDICKTLKTTTKTRHINMRINFIRECINKKIIQLKFVPTKSNVADVLTKPLGVEYFTKHREILMKGFDGCFDWTIGTIESTQNEVLNSISSNNLIENINKKLKPNLRDLNRIDATLIKRKVRFNV